MTAEEKAKKYANDNFEHCTYHHDKDERITDIDKVESSYLHGYKDATQWRDPKEAPQNTDMLVKYTIVGDIFDYTCLEKDCDDTWHWRGEEWDVDKYPIIGWRPIE